MYRRIGLWLTATIILVATVGVTTANVANAQVVPVGGDLDINAFRPAMDSRGYVTVNASQTLAHLDVSFGLVTTWAHKLLTFQNGANKYEVTNLFAPTIIGAIGLNFGLDMELGFSIPFGIMTGDRSPDNPGDPLDPNDNENFNFSGQGSGNIGTHLKVRFLNTSKGPKIGVAAIGSLYLPTGSESGKWLAESGLTPQIMGIVDKEFGSKQQFRIAFNGGFRTRLGDSRRYVDNTTLGTPVPPVTGEVIDAKSTIPFGVGVAYAVVPEKFELVAESFGELPLDGENFAPLEALAGLKLYLARNSFLSLGAGRGLRTKQGGNPKLRAYLGIVFEPSIGDRDGDGIKDDVDQCPDDPEDYDDFSDSDGCPDPDNDSDGILDEDDQCPNNPEDYDGDEDEDGCPEGDALDRDGDGILDKDDQCPDEPEDKDEYQDLDGCPDPDNDGDGILDVDDLCPDEAEDTDGFEDDDGCPDPDNDRDRILDNDDQCPNEPETYNGKDDDDGCPDKGPVVVTDTKIEILEKIYFETASAKIKKRSFPILDAIAATMVGNPGIKLIEIQGHTDERGSDSYNLKLSNSRAASVRTYLIDAGVESHRLESQGYGERQPIDPRSNSAAWTKNRRVEFLILKRLQE